MSLIRENFIELEGSIQKFSDKYNKTKKDYMPLMFNVSNSERSQENHFGIGALAQMTEWDGSVSYQELAKGYENNYRHIKYSTGMKVEEAIMRFKEYKDIKKRANKMAQSVHKTIQKQAASPFNNAFNPLILGPDEQPLASASHRIVPNDDAGVQSNLGTYEMTVDKIEDIKI